MPDAAPSSPADRVPTPSPLRRLLLPVCVALALPSCARREPDGPKRAPVILVSIDTLRADHLNCYGYEAREVSPNLDALADDGILHISHVSASPWTTPSHASLLTGLHPTAHGMTGTFNDLFDDGKPRFNQLDESVLTLAEVLKAHGYATRAYTGGITLDPVLGFGQGFDEYTTSTYKMRDGELEAMLDWLEAQRESPPFLFWHTFEVHAPYLDTRFLGDEPAGLTEEYAALAAQLGDPVSLAAHAEGSAGLRSILERHDAFDPGTTGRLYDGGIASVDEWVGELVAGLRRRGLYQDALVLITSDHGEELGERDPNRIYDAHGRSAYEEMIRVPLIVKLPSSRLAGLEVDAVTRAVDVVPTVLDLLALDQVPTHGASLRGVWTGAERSGGRIAFSEATSRAPEVKSVRRGPHKLIVSVHGRDVVEHGRQFVPDHSPRLLFDLSRDPLERQNLLHGADPRTRRLAAELDRILVGLASQEAGATSDTELTDEMVDRLRALGYVK